MLDTDLHLVSEEHYNLGKLYTWLTYELSTAGLSGLAFFIPYGSVLLVLMLAAIIFTPYMVWRLFNARRYGWIAGFVITVGLPFLVSQLADPADIVVGYILSSIPLVTFYIYTWLLRLWVSEWLLEKHY